MTAALHHKGIHLNHKTVQQLMEEQELVCRVRVKKYRSYKEKAGKIAPNLLSRNILCRKEQSEMNHRCNGVQIVWSETLPFSDPGSAQQVLGALYYL